MQSADKTRAANVALMEALNIPSSAIVGMRASFDQVFAEAIDAGHSPEAAGVLVHHSAILGVLASPSMRGLLLRHAARHPDPVSKFTETASTVASAIALEAIGSASS